MNVAQYVSIGGESGAGFGVYNMTGGTATFCNVNHWTTNLAPSGGTGILNVTGTAHLTQSLTNITLAYNTNSATAIVNLGAAGSASDTSILSTSNLYAPTNLGIVNFHGGTLQALAATGDSSHTYGTNTGLLIGTKNYLYSEAHKIDSNGYPITIGTALLAPLGNGVTSIPVTNGGSGFIGAGDQDHGRQRHGRYGHRGHERRQNRSHRHHQSRHGLYFHADRDHLGRRRHRRDAGNDRSQPEYLRRFDQIGRRRFDFVRYQHLYRHHANRGGNTRA